MDTPSGVTGTELGVVAAATSLFTLFITKGAEVIIARQKARAEVDAKGVAANSKIQEEWLKERKEELDKLRSELEALRTSNIEMQVERARQELVEENLRASVAELTATVTRLRKQVQQLIDNGIGTKPE